MGNLRSFSAGDPGRRPVEKLFGDPLAHYRRDTNLDGQPIVLAGQQHAKGLAIHAYTPLEYNLGVKYKELKAAVGVGSRAQAQIQSLVRVLVIIECDGA